MVGSAEGVVNLMYVFGLYRLIAAPLIGLLASFADPTVVRGLNLVLLAVAVVAALVIVVAIARSAGFKAAAVVLADLGTHGRALCQRPGAGRRVRHSQRRPAAGRRRAGRRPGRRSLADLGNSGRCRDGLAGAIDVRVARGRHARSVATANRRRLAVVVGCVLDLVYLLLAYALLRTPLTEELSLVVPIVIAATIVTAVAALMWLVLLVRMQVLAGALGVLLGLLLGAPLLLSLPLLDGRLVPDVRHSPAAPSPGWWASRSWCC